LSYLPLILQAVLLLIVVPAAIFDFRERRVPNWLALTGVVLGICTNFGVRHLDGLVTSLEGLGLAFLIYFPLYVLRGMGAGDVKLMGAVGLRSNLSPFERSTNNNGYCVGGGQPAPRRTCA